jgi:hypothetical protein
MSGKVVRPKLVHFGEVDDKKLKQIADILEIPEANRDGVLSGEIHIVPKKRKRGKGFKKGSGGRNR